METRSKRRWSAVTVLFAVTAVLLSLGLWTRSTDQPTSIFTDTTRTTGVTSTSGVAQQALRQPASLTSSKMSISAPAVAVPLVIEIPSIDVKSPVLAVGMTKAHAMAAPEGGANSPYWADTFWYRGSSVPGAVGTATIAGHIDDAYGRYAVFGRLSSLVRGDRINIGNTKTGLRETFVVTATHMYTLAQTTTRPVLNLMYGSGPPRGLGPLPSRDGRAHLSLITCAGTWDNAVHSHNERLVVSAVRIR
jgi:sortase (surface protein transpeptidase)